MLNDLDKAKYKLLVDNKSIFIANVLLQLKIVEDDTIPTACVDGTTISISPDLWNKSSLEEKIFILAHETWHVVLEHTCIDLNVSSLDLPTLFKAADHTINIMLSKQGYEVFSWALCDMAYDGLSTKEIYDILISKQKNNQSTGNYFDTFQQGKTKAENESTKKDIENIVVKAAIIADQCNACGSIPSDVARKIHNLTHPKLPWFKILSKHLNEITKSDYTYKKFNRRYLPNLYLPSLDSNNKLSEIAIATDASGSVSDEDYAVFFSEIKNILYRLKPKKITLLPFDTKILNEITLKKVADIHSIKSSGYGGTDVVPVLEWAKKNKPKLLIIFSDMDFYNFEHVLPPCPVIWVGVNSVTHNVPFGKYINYETTK